MTQANSEAPIICLQNVSVRYERSERWIGGGIDLNLYAGETVLLLGPSGCGKSTLLLTLSGLIPTSLDADLRGRVLCDGVSTHDASAGRLAGKIGIVFQDPDAQVITGSLLDEVCFGLENLLVPVDEIEPRALAALRRVGLADTRKEALCSPAGLSGGERQRLAIACTLALDSPVLLLDEPTANLDPVASADFYATLAMLKHPSRAIILIEHELDDAILLADRVVVLDENGAIFLEGSPVEVICKHARDLRRRGIWLPTATAIALCLGLDADAECLLPLTVDALARSLDERKAPVATVATQTELRMSSASQNPGQDVAIDVRSVSVMLDGLTVLQNIDLKIYRGEFLGIAGVNGAGKSTLTRAIAGLLPLSSGSIMLGNTPLSRLDARRIGNRIGYVFQNPEHQFLARSVRDELAYGLRVRRLLPSEIGDRVDSMLHRFDLARYADVNPFMLSHGEKRRLSVATALITEPDVLILDEPTFGQDHARAFEIVRTISELNAAGTTIIMISHDLQLVADHTDRVALLSQGRLLEIGETGSVLCNTQLIERAGLRPSPVRRVALALSKDNPEWRTIYRTSQIREVTP